METQQPAVTALSHWLEIEVPDTETECEQFGTHDFAAAWKPLAEADAAYWKAMDAERKRLNVPGDVTQHPNCKPMPDGKFQERCDFQAHLREVTDARYRESYGDLNGEGPCWLSSRERESEPHADCHGSHSVGGFEIVLFAQKEHYEQLPQIKEVNDDWENPNGEFKNVACYYGQTVLLVNGSPTTEQVKGRYRLNDHTVLVVEGIDNVEIAPKAHAKPKPLEKLSDPVLVGAGA